MTMIPDKAIHKATAIITMMLVSLSIRAAVSDISSDTRIQRMEATQSETEEKPTIDSISDPIIFLDDYCFTAEFTVYFHGTDNITVFQEEEYCTNLLSTRYEGEGEVQVKTTKMSGLFYSWLHIQASNEYKTWKTVEIPPLFPSTDYDAVAVEIICNDDSESDVLSAYLPHAFSMEKGDFTLSYPKWTLLLPLDNGGFKVINLNDDDGSCTTIPLDIQPDYSISEDGILQAQLFFNGRIEDLTAVTRQYDINFNFKPFIEYALIEKIEDEAPSPSYNAYYKVKYHGADNIQVYVEEEYGSAVRRTFIYEPDIAYGCATHIKAPYKAWIDFVAENKFGKDTYTIELLPYGEVANGVENVIDGSSSSGTTNGLMEVYDVHGRKLADITAISEVYQLPVKGLLLIRGTPGTKKILVR